MSGVDKYRSQLLGRIARADQLNRQIDGRRSNRHDRQSDASLRGHRQALIGSKLLDG
jgi:hypothetical protein